MGGELGVEGVDLALDVCELALHGDELGCELARVLARGLKLANLLAECGDRRLELGRSLREGVMGVSGLDEGVTRGDAGLVLVACHEGVARGLGCLDERRLARGGVGELGAARVDLALSLGEGVKGAGLLALELLAARLDLGRGVVDGGLRLGELVLDLSELLVGTFLGVVDLRVAVCCDLLLAGVLTLGLDGLGSALDVLDQPLVLVREATHAAGAGNAQVDHGVGAGRRRVARHEEGVLGARGAKRGRAVLGSDARGVDDLAYDLVGVSGEQLGAVSRVRLEVVELDVVAVIDVLEEVGGAFALVLGRVVCRPRARIGVDAERHGVAYAPAACLEVLARRGQLVRTGGKAPLEQVGLVHAVLGDGAHAHGLARAGNLGVGRLCPAALRRLDAIEARECAHVVIREAKG